MVPTYGKGGSAGEEERLIKIIFDSAVGLVPMRREMIDRGSEELRVSYAMGLLALGHCRGCVRVCGGCLGGGRRAVHVVPRVLQWTRHTNTPIFIDCGL